eukprot:1326422-Pleurochrysis_carterae.AAC.2
MARVKWRVRSWARPQSAPTHADLRAYGLDRADGACRRTVRADLLPKADEERVELCPEVLRHPLLELCARVLRVARRA